MIGMDVQTQRKQYRLKYHVNGITHSAMGDTLISIAKELSTNNTQFKLWDKGQLIVILRRTKIGKHTYFLVIKMIP